MMKGVLTILAAEFAKVKRSPILWLTFIAFSAPPILGAIFIEILRDDAIVAAGGPLVTKAAVMNFTPNLSSYLQLLTQAVGIGGILVFGFVASWVFGSEFSQGTVKDLLALPTSRANIIHAKFVTYFIWCTALVVSNLILGIGLCTIVRPEGWNDFQMIVGILPTYSNTAALTVALGTPIAFFAIAGRGYLAPLGLASGMLVLAQVLGAVGYGAYFPYSVPGLYSGISPAHRLGVNEFSFAAVYATGLLGYLGSVLWFQHADHTE
jgi:ABC-type transport system involved in multi-copper enzyme maturation permease subunit